MYLLFVFLTALCSAVVKTYERYYENSIFFHLSKKFWHFNPDKSFSAMNVSYVGKLLFICMAIVCAQIHTFQILFHKIAFIIQILIIAVVYAVVNLIAMALFTIKTHQNEQQQTSLDKKA